MHAIALHRAAALDASDRRSLERLLKSPLLGAESIFLVAFSAGAETRDTAHRSIGSVLRSSPVVP